MGLKGSLLLRGVTHLADNKGFRMWNENILLEVMHFALQYKKGSVQKSLAFQSTDMSVCQYLNTTLFPIVLLQLIPNGSN